MKKFSSLMVLVIAFSAWTGACSSEAGLGESCSDVGKTSGTCASGSVCGKDTGGAILCLKVCTAQSDCSADRDCNGVDGTNIKGCRAKDSSSSSDAGADAKK